MSDSIYERPMEKLNTGRKEEILSLVGSILPFKKIILFAIISTFISVFLWMIIFAITVVMVMLIDEGIIDTMSDHMAAGILIALVVPGSLIANIMVLVNLKSRLIKNA